MTKEQFSQAISDLLEEKRKTGNDLQWWMAFREAELYVEGGTKNLARALIAGGISAIPTEFNDQINALYDEVSGDSILIMIMLEEIREFWS